jgi:hypothetical protein
MARAKTVEYACAAFGEPSVQIAVHMGLSMTICLHILERIVNITQSDAVIWFRNSPLD